MNDTIFLNGMRFYAYHGALPAENEIGQIFVVDVTLKVNLEEAGQSDEGPPCNLIEHLAERIAKRINSHYNRVMETKVRITKENPPIPGHYNGVGIEIVRENR